MATLNVPTAPETDPATEARPFYTKVLSGTNSPDPTTPRYLISCDEGWRVHIVCSGMYEWAADWLIEVLDRRPYPQPH